MRSGNCIPELRVKILAGLGGSSAVRLQCVHPRKLARELRKQLQMCDIRVESTQAGNTRMRTPEQGVLVITWKKLP